MNKKDKSILHNVDIKRAWEDAEYRNSLTKEQQELLAQESPLAPDELSDDQLEEVTGGTGSVGCFNPNVVRQ